MGANEVDIVCRLAHQYLNPQYRFTTPEELKAQMLQEEGVFAQAIAVLAQKDQEVLKIWKIVKKAKRQK